MVGIIKRLASLFLFSALVLSPGWLSAQCLRQCSDTLCGGAEARAIAGGVLEEDENGIRTIRIERLHGEAPSPRWEVGATPLEGPFDAPDDMDGGLFFVYGESVFTFIWSSAGELSCIGDPPIPIEDAIAISQSPNCPRAARAAGMRVGPCEDVRVYGGGSGSGCVASHVPEKGTQAGGGLLLLLGLSLLRGNLRRA